MRLAILAPTGFDGLYGQDAYAYYDFVHELRNAVNEGRTPGAFFWPLGYPILLLVALTLFGDHIAVAQGLNALLGAVLPPLVYILARAIGLRRTGALVAGLLMAICGQALQSSLVIMSDIPALFWATASAVSLIRYWKHPRQSSRWLALSIILLSIASITRWSYLILFIPWGISVGILWKGHIHWKAIALGLISLLAVLAPQLVYSRITASPGLSHEWAANWSLSHAFEREFTNIDGHFFYEQINAVYYAQAIHGLYFMPPFLSVFIPFGLLKRPPGWIAILGGWMVLPYLFLCGIPYQNIRFILIVFPPVALLVGAGIETVIRWMEKVKIRQYPFPTVLATLAALVIVAYGAGQTLTTAQESVRTFIERQQADKAVAQWISHYIPGGSNVYTFGLTLTLKHYTNLMVFELYYETPETLKTRWLPGQGDYLLLNLWDITYQWAGREPDIAYHWLSDQRGLTRLGQYGNYTLFRIKG